MYKHSTHMLVSIKAKNIQAVQDAGMLLKE